MQAGALCQQIGRQGLSISRPRAQAVPQRAPLTRAVSTQQAGQRADYFRSDKRPIILFDGVCNICNGGVDFVLDWDKRQCFRFAPLQNDAGRALLQRCGRQPDDISSIVLVEEDRCLIKSEAILRIAQRLDAPWPQLAMPGFIVPLGLRDVLYDQVANNRYTVFGKRKQCRMCDERLSGENFLA